MLALLLGLFNEPKIKPHDYPCPSITTSLIEMRTFVSLLSPRNGQSPLDHQPVAGDYHSPTFTGSAALLPCPDDDPSCLFPMINKQLWRDRSASTWSRGGCNPFEACLAATLVSTNAAKIPHFQTIGSSNEARDLRDCQFIQGPVYWRAVRQTCFDLG